MPSRKSAADDLTVSERVYAAPRPGHCVTGIVQELCVTGWPGLCQVRTLSAVRKPAALTTSDTFHFFLAPIISHQQLDVVPGHITRSSAQERREICSPTILILQPTLEVPVCQSLISRLIFFSFIFISYHIYLFPYFHCKKFFTVFFAKQQRMSRMMIPCSGEKSGIIAPSRNSRDISEVPTSQCCPVLYLFHRISFVAGTFQGVSA